MRETLEALRHKGRNVGFFSKNLAKVAPLALVCGIGLFSTGDLFGETLEGWIQKEEKFAASRLLDATVDHGDGHLTLVASADPNVPAYNFHWVRDAAAVMRSILYLYQVNRNSEIREKYTKYFEEYVAFSRKIQEAPNPSGGVGEPKFHPDGTPFLGDWARPQNDGPASRAITLISWAQLLIREGKEDYVKKHLYDSTLPTQSVIKTDLEYVANNWRISSFDLWEETKGKHFYTLMMERRALLDGAQLARELADPNAAEWYTQQAKSIESQLELFWDPTRHILMPSRDVEGSSSARESGLDSSVILAVVLGHTQDHFMEFDDERVLATLHALENRFQSLYSINHNPDIPGLAIGRYPEDRYDGYSTVSEGNPWIPLTAIFSQFYERLALHYEKAGACVMTDVSMPFFNQLLAGREEASLAPGVYSSETPEFARIVRALRFKARAYLSRIAYHAGPNGELSEQLNRDTGYLQGAQHLAASYATVLWAIWARRGDFPNPQQPSNP